MLQAAPILDAADGYLLGVDQSLSGRGWMQRPYDHRSAETLAQRHSLPLAVARALSARQVSLGAVEDYLHPTLRTLLPNPMQFKDMPQAAARFVQAVMQQETAVVWGDYDVDGATSSALLMRFARSAGLQIGLYVPDRGREGYGLNDDGLRQLADTGNKLVVCVDCGTTAFGPIATAQAAGVEVIVLDHHTAEMTLPSAVAVVNPNRFDETGDYGHLAAVGVTFLFVVAVNKLLREAGWYNADRKEPDLLQLLDLVALGTVCDVVPLVGLNRAFVAQGLRMIAQTEKPGFKALAVTAGLKNRPDCVTLGFAYGPRVNAGGRVGQSNLGAKLLATDDGAEANAIAHLLEEFNAERKRLEEETLAAADRQAAEMGDAPLLIVAGQGWHPGVIGIVAGRLKEKYHKPAIVIALQDGVGKASCRSVHGLDIGSLVIAARQADLVVNGGGHAMAAGFTVSAEKLALLRAFLDERVSAHIAHSPVLPTLMLDGVLAGPAVTLELAEQLTLLHPFGTGNPEPKFALPNSKIVYAAVVGEKHIRCTIENAGKRVEAIAFRALGTDLGSFLLNGRGKPCHVAGRVRVNEYLTVRNVQLQIDDVALPA